MTSVHEEIQVLIQEDKYRDALKLARENKDEVSPTHLAYVYYKLGMDDIENLKEEFEKRPDHDKHKRTFQHILAQYYYKVGDSVKSLKIYNDLITSSLKNVQFKSDLVDLSVNQRAVYAQLLLQDKDFKCDLISTSTISYDQLFNDAFINIVNGDLDNATEILENALSLANETLAGDSDIHEETNPIKVQLSYLYLLKNDFVSAKQLLDDALQNGAESNKSLNLIIGNNIAAMKSEIKNPHLLFRELDLPNSFALSKDKLTIPQIEILSRNLAELRKGISPKNKAEGLYLVQEKICANNLQAAIQILEKMDVNIPAIGATLIALYELEGCMDKLRKLLQSIKTENKDYKTLIELKKLTVNLDVQLETPRPSINEVKKLISHIDINELSIDDLITPQKKSLKTIKKNKKGNSKVKVIKETPLHWLPKKERPDYKPKKKTLTQGST